MYRWWTISAWRWGLKLGPVTVATYRRCDNLWVWFVCVLNREIWASRDPLDKAVIMVNIERWKQYWSARLENLCH